MALNTYTTIKDAALRWLNREGFTELETDIEDIMQIAQRNIWRTANLNAMLEVTTLTVDSASVTAPTDMLRIKSMTLRKGSQSVDMTGVPVRQLYLAVDSTTPRYFSVAGLNILFGPTPDQEYTADILYYKALTNLSTSNDTNWVSTNYPELIIWATMAEALLWLKDDARAGLYEKRYREVLEQILTSENELAYEGGSLAVKDPVAIAHSRYL